MSNFQPLEVVDRGSETQPQVVENLNKSPWQDRGYALFTTLLVFTTFFNISNISKFCDVQSVAIVNV